MVAPELMVELQAAADNAVRGTLTSSSVVACEEMDQIREESASHGELNIGVPAIRELRDA